MKLSLISLFVLAYTLMLVTWICLAAIIENWPLPFA